MGAMTVLLTRRSEPTSATSPFDPATALSVAMLAGLASAAVGLAGCIAVAVVGWFTGTTGTAAAAVRAGADAWLLGHGAGLRTDEMVVTAIPLGLSLLMGAVLWRVGGMVAHRLRDEPADTGVLTWRTTAIAATGLVVGYASAAALTSVLAGTPAVETSPLRATIGAAVLGVVFGGGALLCAASAVVARGGEPLARIPEELRAAAVGGGAVAMSLLAVGAGLVSGALALDFSAAATVADSLRAGVVGGAIFLLFGVLLLPNACLLAVAFLVGPGFSLGTGTLVSPAGVTLGAVPAFPLLAALPDEGTPAVWTAALVALPVVAGAVGAAVALRRYPVYGLDRAALRGGLVGSVGGAATGLLTVLGGGSVGPGRLAEVGAPALEVALTAAVAAGLGGAIGGVIVRLLDRSARRR